MTERAAAGRLRSGAVVVLAAGLAFTVLAVVLLVDAEREAIDRRFDAAVDRAATRIENGVRDSVDILRAGDGFVSASESVTAAEFATFVDDLALPERHPAIAGYALVGSVAVDDVPALEQRMQQLGRPDFTVRPPEPALPDERRPILHIEPGAANATALGFDVAANPLALAATDRALATGTPALTAPLTLVQEQEGQTGFVVYSPRSGPGPEGPVTIAFVSAVHRGDDFLAGTFAGTDTLATVTLRDAAGGGPAGDGTIGSWRPPSWRPGGATATVVRDVLGRTWAIEVTGPPGAYGTVGAAPWVVGLFGVLATLGAAGLLRSTRTREAEARRIADALTVDLRAEERRVAEANRALEATNRALADSNVELGRFAFVASHDLQEPLRMVASFLDLLEQHLEADDLLDDRGREYLRYAAGGAQRMSALIQDLLVLSRVQRAEKSLAAVPTDSVLADVLLDLRPRIEESGAVVEVGRTDPVLADPTQLVQLLQNLVGNALKFADATRPPLVRVDAWGDDGGDWHLVVADNGIGIEPEFRDRIFEPFTRLHPRDAYEGTGIGLAVCHRVVRAHGGTITAEDGIDGGLAVSVVLPGAAVVDEAG